MTEEHFDRIMTELQDKRPYQVFTIELNGGRRFEIDFPKALIVREGVAVFLAPGGVPIVFDHESINQVIVGPANTAI